MQIEKLKSDLEQKYVLASSNKAEQSKLLETCRTQAESIRNYQQQIDVQKQQLAQLLTQVNQSQVDVDTLRQELQ